MSTNTRRTFLKQASVGAAAVGAVAVLPTALAGSADAAAPSGPVHDGPFLAWVKDAKTGDISILVGTTEVVHRDRALAKRLGQLAADAARS